MRIERSATCIGGSLLVALLALGCAGTKLIDTSPVRVKLPNGFLALKTLRKDIHPGYIYGLKLGPESSQNYNIYNSIDTLRDLLKTTEEIPERYVEREKLVSWGISGLVKSVKFDSLRVSLKSSSVMRYTLNQPAITRLKAVIRATIDSMEAEYAGEFRLVRAVNITSDFELSVRSLKRDTVKVGPGLDLGDVTDFAKELIDSTGTLGVIVTVRQLDSTRYAVKASEALTIGYDDERPKRSAVFLEAPASLGVVNGEGVTPFPSLGISLSATHLVSRITWFNPAIGFRWDHYANGFLLPLLIENRFPVLGDGVVTADVGFSFVPGWINNVSEQSNWQGVGLNLGLSIGTPPDRALGAAMRLVYTKQHSRYFRRDGSDAGGFAFDQVLVSVSPRVKL